ncbi:MAG TPA: hypothetical protein PLL75_05780 [Candidatus Omnitrophota bacterium]|nr:hypothetical protein [Candidatus Omnitrophota bacterium]HPS37217.1 hypothetical protein [Candidatus Omnitrophota bacterium]
MKTFRRYLFYILLVMLGVTFFTQKDFRRVKEIRPEALKQPHQYELTDRTVMRFTRNDYSYEVTPVYGYDISAMIVSRLDYKAFTIYKFDKTFHMDLCMIWGSNLANGVYKLSNVRFFQDCRWCWVQWCGNVAFNMNELSNSHLLVNDPAIEKKVKGLGVGDQVRIKGKLVNVKAKLNGKAGRYDSPDVAWQTSITRTDTGAGACEVIYVEELEVLQRANMLSRTLFRISLYGLILLFLWTFACFVLEIVRLLRSPAFENLS